MKKSFWLIIWMALVMSGCGSKRTITPAKHIDRINHAVPVSSDQTRHLISEARRWIGTPYRWGGQTMSGTDCSGFVLSVYENVYGLKLPRTSSMQWEYALPINENELAPGDLLFFCTSGGSRVSHVGLSIGAGKFIHASASKGVTESSLDEKYYRQHFHSAGRIVSPVAERPSEIASDRRDLQKKIKQLEQEKKKLAKEHTKLVKEQPILTDTTYVDTDPSIFD